MAPGQGGASLEVLLDALPFIAQITGGRAALTDKNGICIQVVDHEGRDLVGERGREHELCRRAAAEGRPLVGAATSHPDADVYAVPLDRYVLAASNVAWIERQSQLRLALQAALPLIAKVAGGEAVIFNAEGRRLVSVLPNGRSSPNLGKISESCQMVMKSGRPDISPSHSVPGAVAVRIPVTPQFGFGFNNALTVQQGQQMLEEVKKRQTARYTWDDIIGESRAMQNALRLARLAAASASPIWIFGESGTGKELFAQAIHNASPRAHKPFVAVNCAALPASLIESTLFGYVEGAFTGARKGGQAGLFEQADGGTLLLDEISEMEIGLQVKLLRVLQEREVTRIGAATARPVDVRIICTSNRDLRRIASEGLFREDLFYRLNVLDIQVPPLRERKEDIPRLVEHQLRTISLREGKLVHRVHPEALAGLIAYDWPGNVRELQNCLERGVSLAEGDTVLPRHLPVYITADAAAAGGAGIRPLAQRLKEAERAAIDEALQATGGNRSQAAALLGISVTTLWRRLRQLDEPAGEPVARQG